MMNPKDFKKSELSDTLKNLLHSKNNKFETFVKELAVLSKEYGVAIKAVSGIQLGKIKEIEYAKDETSGDLIPAVEWAKDTEEA